MAPRILRRTRRGLLLLLFAVSILLILNTSYALLPLDSHIRLSVEFNTARALDLLRRSTTDRDAWLSKPARYPLNLRSDVGYLIKTGYGTRHRVPAQLDAFARSGGMLGEEGRSFIVVGDWTTVNETDAQVLGVRVHDVIRMMMETKVDAFLSGNHHRFLKYKTLQEAVDSGDEERAREIGRRFGWELDALKFIMGLELAYKQMPHKQWYVILDDDTFLIGPSLQLFLSHLDASRPHYIGNAVGDYKTRFAHGGSAVVLSGETLRRLFNRPDMVAQAHMDSLDETWGDRLVATTLHKIGIYLDERYSHHFGSEPPELVRIGGDRVCSPIVSFHGLRKPGAMVGVGRALARVDEPVLWGQLWRLFGKVPMQQQQQQQQQQGMRQTQDHVGPTDERTTTWKRVQSADGCRRKCQDSGCLAWTYDGERRECHGSPWMVVGEDSEEGEDEAEGEKAKVSGINWLMMEPLLRRCS